MENIEKTKMEYTKEKEFKDLVESSLKEKIYIGLGNPKARILFVGKEASRQGEDGYAKEWDEHIKNSTCQKLSFRPLHKDKLRTPGHTWRHYQKLYDYIFEKNNEKKDDKFQIDFLENVFTTEMSAIPSKRTKKAQQNPDFKKALDKRKTFFESNYIHQFSVIVLACGNYIKNNNKIRQIDNTFKVEFHPCNSSEQPFWLHFNTDNRTKLVIHTRQLSGSLSNKLLEGIALQIREFLIEKNLYNDIIQGMKR